MRGHVSPGQLVWVKLYRDKSGRQAVTMRVEEDMVRASVPAEDVKVGDELTGTVYNILPEGFFLLTTQRYLAFIHRSEVPSGRLDFGQKVTGRVTFVREDGRVDMSLREVKEKAMITDSERILALLEKRQGTMPYSDATPPGNHQGRLRDLPRPPFKRALGKLMKEGKITQENGWTSLVK